MLHWTRWVCETILFLSAALGKIRRTGWDSVLLLVHAAACASRQVTQHQGPIPFFPQTVVLRTQRNIKCPLINRWVFLSFVHWWILGVPGRQLWFLALMDLFSGILQMSKSSEPSAAPHSSEPSFPHCPPNWPSDTHCSSCFLVFFPFISWILSSFNLCSLD